jgi:hypothetical protein
MSFSHNNMMCRTKGTNHSIATSLTLCRKKGQGSDNRLGKELHGGRFDTIDEDRILETMRSVEEREIEVA